MTVDLGTFTSDGAVKQALPVKACVCQSLLFPLMAAINACYYVLYLRTFFHKKKELWRFLVTRQKQSYWILVWRVLKLEASSILIQIHLVILQFSFFILFLFSVAFAGDDRNYDILCVMLLFQNLIWLRYEDFKEFKYIVKKYFESLLNELLKFLFYPASRVVCGWLFPVLNGSSINRKKRIDKRVNKNILLLCIAIWLHSSELQFSIRIVLTLKTKKKIKHACIECMNCLTEILHSMLYIEFGKLYFPPVKMISNKLTSRRKLNIWWDLYKISIYYCHKLNHLFLARLW